MGSRAGLAFSFAYSPGNWLSASTPPEIELRVVSLPPTISSNMLPRNSLGGMLRVASFWARCEMRSAPRELAFCRSCQIPLIYSKHFHNSAKPSCGVSK